jgi:hypothetical protein
MMTGINDTKYLVQFLQGANANAQRDTLIEGGPLKVGLNNYFKICFPSHVVASQGEYEYNLHHMEHVFLDVFDWPEYAMGRGLTWFLLPKKVSRFLQRADTLGILLWTVWSNEEEAIQHLRWVKEQLPPDEQRFTQDDMMEYPEDHPITKLMDRIRATMFKDAGGHGMTAAVDFKSMLGDAYIKSRRDAADGHHQSMISILLDAASPNDLSAKPLAVQASTVARFVGATQPPRQLRRYMEYYLQEQEITRRAQSESGRFIPLLITARDAGGDGGYKELKLAIPHACGGAEFVEFVKLLGVRAKLHGELTSTTCTALCDMLRGEVLHELNTDEMLSPITGTNTIRASRIGDLLALTSTRASGDEKKSGADKAAAEKMRLSTEYIALTSALEAHISETPDYKAVITILAATAVGRIFLSGGAAASPIMAKFTACKQHSLLDEALNKLLAVDEDGIPLGKWVIKPGTAILLIKGKFGAMDFDPWTMLCRPIIAIRDGAEAANGLSNDRGSFWSDYERLVLCKPIMVVAMSFIGHMGRSAGSYISFHDGMTSRARKVKGLPSHFLKKAGLTKKLAQIGSMVMTSQASQDGVTIVEPIGVAHLRQPFFSPDFLAHMELTVFDGDMEEARSKMRLHEDYGDDEDGNFRGGKRQRNDRNSQQQQATGGGRSNGSADSKPPGYMLETWSVYLTNKGPIYGCKFLVDWSASILPSQIPDDTCLGALCYLTNASRRSGWCNKLTCSHHPRPSNLPESAFKVVNVQADDNTAADAITAASVLSDQRNWQHWGGPANHDILGGKGGRPFSTANDSYAGRGFSMANDSYAGRGKGRGKGSGKGSSRGGRGKGGGRGGADKGKGGKGKGQGKGGKGDTSNFGRQH